VIWKAFSSNLFGRLLICSLSVLLNSATAKQRNQFADSLHGDRRVAVGQLQFIFSPHILNQMRGEVNMSMSWGLDRQLFDENIGQPCDRGRKKHNEYQRQGVEDPVRRRISDDILSSKAARVFKEILLAPGYGIFEPVGD
jgi:hypothetical protein